MKFDRRLTDEIYTSDTVRLGKDAFQAMQETIYLMAVSEPLPGTMMPNCRSCRSVICCCII